MNFWRRGVGWEWIFVIARSLELRALPYALNRPPRAAASFNKRIEPMRGSAFRLVPHAGVCGALPLMAHPQRWALSTP